MNFKEKFEHFKITCSVLYDWFVTKKLKDNSFWKSTLKDEIESAKRRHAAKKMFDTTKSTKSQIPNASDAIIAKIRASAKENFGKDKK